MNSSTEPSQVAALAAQYRQQGYTVLLEPAPDKLPFNLGSYRPDLLVKKGDEHLLIEVKNRHTPVSISRLREVAELVNQQAGWRFLFVNTGPDAEDGHLPQSPISWTSIVQRIAQAKHLRESGEPEAAILLLWSAFEALLRRHAESLDLPLEQASVRALLDYLYSEADLSYEHFEQAKKLLVSRNQLAHGFPLPEAAQQAAQLQSLVDDLSNEWRPTREAA
ncbi:MAG TPA: hypothetical protein VF629_12550 [Hymenobacter sp.]|jgi:hypothetical protein|uniref:hypothetical protein n=1 Tax=Hymenobacter sp. TaxID=1898978 RepID=UPI002ED93318